MPSEHDSEMVHALRLAIKWKEFKTFCNARTLCDGCPYFSGNHICSFTSTEKILTKIAEEGRSYLIREGIPVNLPHE